MDNFYYNLLNIGEKKSKESIKEAIEKSIFKNLSDIKKYSNTLEGLCKVIGYNVGNDLKEQNINVNYFNVKDIIGNFEHIFLLVDYIEKEEIKYILIDPTFIQFVKNGKYLNPILKNYPSEVLNLTKRGKEILKDLINQKYMEITESDFKLYLGSFINEIDINKIDVNIQNLVFNIKRR